MVAQESIRFFVDFNSQFHVFSSGSDVFGGLGRRRSRAFRGTRRPREGEGQAVGAGGR